MVGNLSQESLRDIYLSRTGTHAASLNLSLQREAEFHMLLQVCHSSHLTESESSWEQGGEGMPEG